MIALLDIGLGNLRSVERALLAAGASSVQILSDPDQLARASRVVFPGQGAFGDCSAALNQTGGALRQALQQVLSSGKPYLGLCLGLQVLFEQSEEAQNCAGLGWFAGNVVRLTATQTCKIPHMGWNTVTPTTDSSAKMLGTNQWYYFVHSYAVAPKDPAIIAAHTEHAERFVSAVHRDNVWAVQFHPEKSQEAGLTLLRNWLAT